MFHLRSCKHCLFHYISIYFAILKRSKICSSGLGLGAALCLLPATWLIFWMSLFFGWSLWLCENRGVVAKSVPVFEESRILQKSWSNLIYSCPHRGKLLTDKKVSLLRSLDSSFPRAWLGKVINRCSQPTLIPDQNILLETYRPQELWALIPSEGFILPLLLYLMSIIVYHYSASLSNFILSFAYDWEVIAPSSAFWCVLLCWVEFRNITTGVRSQ